MKHLRIEKDGNVAVIYLSIEPENQFTTPYFRELCETLDQLAEDRGVKALVFASGIEKFFSTGLHLAWVLAEAPTGSEVLPEYFGLLNRFMITLTGYPKPTIAVINGHAAGMGFVTTGCMDFRFMAPDKGFLRLPEVEINIPFTPGANELFRDIVSPQAWRDMAYTGEKKTGQQGFEMGFIDQLHPFDELIPAAVALAKKLGVHKTSTYAKIKRVNKQRVLDVMIHEDPKVIEEMIKTYGMG